MEAEHTSIWLRPARGSRGRAPEHTRDGIAAVAVRLADSDGLGAVTMRSVAEALGGRVVRVIEVQEGGSIVRPLVNDSTNFIRARAAQDATPVEPGSLDIYAQVTLVAEVEPKP